MVLISSKAMKEAFLPSKKDCTVSFRPCTTRENDLLKIFRKLLYSSASAMASPICSFLADQMAERRKVTTKVVFSSKDLLLTKRTNRPSRPPSKQRDSLKKGNSPSFAHSRCRTFSCLTRKLFFRRSRY